MTFTLETRDLTIRFGGHVAVNRVSCTFRPGELTAIVGPNGAGKTTYFNLISGQLRPSDGRILLDGADITQLSAPLRTRAGLGRAFQLTNLFPNLSVEERSIRIWPGPCWIRCASSRSRTWISRSATSVDCIRHCRAKARSASSR